jgi:uncharacterized cupredoxin-like copper-binding protein
VPVLAAGAMAFSSLFVVSNSLRLRGKRLSDEQGQMPATGNRLIWGGAAIGIAVALVVGYGWVSGWFQISRPAFDELKVTTSQLEYTPEVLVVEVDRPIRLTFVNDSALTHDFSVMDIQVVQSDAAEDDHTHEMDGAMPDLHMAASAGQTATLEFTPTRPGTYEFYCTVEGHKDAGMVGTLIVKQAGG